MQNGKITSRRGGAEDLKDPVDRMGNHPDEEEVLVDTGEGTLTGALLDLMMAEKAGARLGVIGAGIKR